jgi:TELO2-interacting protein 1
LAKSDALDEKLAEYAFFPLTHIFNETKRLSSPCLQLAVEAVTILAAKGWRQQLPTELGKQMLILMTLIAGADAKQKLEPPSEELKAACFAGIDILIQHLAMKSDRQALFNDVVSKSIVDQLAYLLLEAVTTESSDQVQLAASEALFALVSAIKNRVLLASLLPRTASSLTQSLRSSTEAKRTRKVLISYLRVLTYIFKSVLADSVVFPLPGPTKTAANQTSADSSGLDESWLRATASQVNLVVIQVSRLRKHDHSDVRHAIAELCLMLISECQKSLPDASSTSFDTVVTIASMEDGEVILSKFETVVSTHPSLVRTLTERGYEWLQALPRTMQSNDDNVRAGFLGRLRIALLVVAHHSGLPGALLRVFVNRIIEALAVLDRNNRSDTDRIAESGEIVVQASPEKREQFLPLLMTAPSQSESKRQLNDLIETFRELGVSASVAKLAIESAIDLDGPNKIAGAWLSMACLKDGRDQQSIMDFVDDDGEDSRLARPYLVSELYAATLPFLLTEDPNRDWRLSAMAIENTILQATQLHTAYRAELVDTLYPILALLGSENGRLRNHAMMGLIQLAQACAYSSTGDMLIGNVDYLINAVGMRLNSFDISPQAPQVLLMMLKLCGARIVPYLDDLIGSIFSALDNFHGYPEMVELLFRVLKTIVNESRKQPALALTNGLEDVDHSLPTDHISKLDDILEDLRRRKSRKRKHQETDNDPVNAPHRPWKSFNSEIDAIEKENDRNDEDRAAETSQMPTDTDKDVKLSKSHELLLSIAKSTTPHLTSPSPQVRSILLQLLDEVAPLLAKHENTFLPLINAIWPAAVPRLLEYDDEMVSNETSYNICAAADTITTLCQGAGSFMSTRIEDIFPKLRRLFEKVTQNSRQVSTGKTIGTNLVKTIKNDVITYPGDSRSRIQGALLRLLRSILGHVRLSADRGDEIFELIAPFAEGDESKDISRSLKDYNEDMLWLWRERQRKVVIGGTTEGAEIRVLA